MDARRLWTDPRARVGLVILSCFLLASTGWLAWLYHLTDLAAPEAVDVLTMVVGYLMQAAGIGAFVVVARQQDETTGRRVTSAAIVAYALCLVPATLAPSLAPVLAFGYLANLICGYFQGHYLCLLTRVVDHDHRGSVFGCAYAATTACGWLLALAPGGLLTHGVGGLVTCLVMALLAALLVRKPLPSPAAETPSGSDAAETTSDGPGARSPQGHGIMFPAGGGKVDGSVGPLACSPAAAGSHGRMPLLVLACITVMLMSLTKGSGFSFPTTDLVAGINIELSRLLYGVGLLAAGFVCDRNRTYGAYCCMGALVTPFLMLALSGAAAPATLMWALGYLLFGFFAVYRVVLLTDLADAADRPELAGLGQLSGRVGDALGTAFSVAFVGTPLVLITVASVLFACTMLVFFMLDQRLHPAPAQIEPNVPTEEEVFERFAARHDLSAREREVLRLVLDEHTNAEIAAELFVSEATVKFHVRNILKKTGRENRMKVLQLYAEEARQA